MSGASDGTAQSNHKIEPKHARCDDSCALLSTSTSRISKISQGRRRRAAILPLSAPLAHYYFADMHFIIIISSFISADRLFPLPNLIFVSKFMLFFLAANSVTQMLNGFHLLF